MLKLTQDDGWVELRPANGKEPAVKARFKPASRSMRRRARIRALQALEIKRDEIGEMTPLDFGDVGDLYSYELLRMGLVEWSGVGDHNEAPIGITPPETLRLRTCNDDDRPTGSIDQFLAIDDIFEAGDRIYVMPIVEREKEKNGLSVSPNGTGEAGTQAKAIAGSSATPRKADGAKNASTASRSRRAPKARKSGSS